uniref:Multidrug and toxin extrusion protein n=1 Tax=Catagonus wagneri TaxID=51154 RepID=A0A8C3WSG8_9CETA
METPAAPAPEAPVAAPDGAQCPGVPGWRRCLRGLRGALPPDFLAQLMIFLISIVSSIFCGHLGRAELDAAMLAAFGGRNLKRVGVILQRGVLILLLSCFPCWAFFINTESLLLLLRQDPEVSRSAAYLFFCFILQATFLFQLQAKYLQNQGIILPQVVSGIAANILNVGINALLLSALDLGIGSAWANATSQFVLSALLFLYVRWKKIYVSTWGGWTMDCFQEWGSFTRLAVPSTFMVCIEWWTFEIGTFLAGLSRVQRKPISSLANHVSRVPLGFSVAASVRVGNALGAGDPEQARHSCVTLLTVLTAEPAGSIVINTALHCGFRVGDSFLFPDRAIISLVSRVMPFLAPFHLFDALAGTSGGVLRGTGKQKMGAFLNAIGYYVFGFPLGVSLMFAANCGVIGKCRAPGRGSSSLTCHTQVSRLGDKALVWKVGPAG